MGDNNIHYILGNYENVYTIHVIAQENRHASRTFLAERVHVVSCGHFSYFDESIGWPQTRRALDWILSRTVSLPAKAKDEKSTMGYMLINALAKL